MIWLELALPHFQKNWLLIDNLNFSLPFIAENAKYHVKNIFSFFRQMNNHTPTTVPRKKWLAKHDGIVFSLPYCNTLDGSLTVYTHLPNVHTKFLNQP